MRLRVAQPHLTTSLVLLEALMWAETIYLGEMSENKLDDFGETEFTFDGMPDMPIIPIIMVVSTNSPRNSFSLACIA